MYFNGIINSGATRVYFWVGEGGGSYKEARKGAQFGYILHNYGKNKEFATQKSGVTTPAPP